jgi:hypothetical protein
VPNNCAEDPRLGNWVGKQRTLKRQLDRGEAGRGMTAEGAARLTALGFEWEPAVGGPKAKSQKPKVKSQKLGRGSDAAWEATLVKLQAHQQEHGNINIHKESEHRTLQQWVMSQRAGKKKLDRGERGHGRGMMAARAARLDALGFAWTGEMRLANVRAPAAAAEAAIPERFEGRQDEDESEEEEEESEKPERDESEEEDKEEEEEEEEDDDEEDEEDKETDKKTGVQSHLRHEWMDKHDVERLLSDFANGAKTSEGYKLYPAGHNFGLPKAGRVFFVVVKRGGQSSGHKQRLNDDHSWQRGPSGSLSDSKLDIFTESGKEVYLRTRIAKHEDDSQKLRLRRRTYALPEDENQSVKVRMLQYASLEGQVRVGAACKAAASAAAGER